MFIVTVRMVEVGLRFEKNVFLPSVVTNQTYFVFCYVLVKGWQIESQVESGLASEMFGVVDL